MPVFAVAEFSVIIFALALFIFFWAAMPLIVATGSGIASILRGFPAIGDAMADWIMARTHDVEREMRNTLEDWVHVSTIPFVDLMNGWANTMRHDSYYQRIVMSNMVGVLAHVSHAQQHQVTQPVVDTVNHTVTNNIENTNNYITQVVGVNQQYVDQSLSQSYTWAEAGFAAVYATVNQLASDVNDTIRWAQGEFIAANDYAASVAEQARAGAVEQANTYTADSFTVLEGYVTQTVDWVGATLAATAESLTDYTTQHIAASEAHVAGELATMGAIVTTAVTVFEDFMRNCGEPMCESGLPFFKGLGSILDLLGAGVFVGFLVEAARNPEGTAQAVLSEAEDIVSVPTGVAEAIFGKIG